MVPCGRLFRSAAFGANLRTDSRLWHPPRLWTDDFNQAGQAMQSNSVIAAFRSFLSGDREHAVDVIRQIEAHEQSSGRSAIALQLRRLLDSQGGMVRLPDAPPEIRLYQPSKPLADLVLPACVRNNVERLIAERQRADLLRDHGLAPRSAVLLFGPSGNGKTALAGAVAHALSLPLAVVNYGEAIDSYMGETSKSLAKVMKFARDRACVLLFDEADSLLRGRTGGGSGAERESDRIVNHLLIELDDRPRDSIVMFASNFVGALDPAFCRRIETRIELPAPDAQRRHDFVFRVSGRWPFLDCKAVESAAAWPSYAECEQAVEDAARRWLLSQPTQGAA